MLLSILNTTNEKEFEQCVHAIQYAYWPDEKLLSIINNEYQIKDPIAATTKLKEMIENITPYQLIRNFKNSEMLPMPFITNYHTLFGNRVSNILEKGKDKKEMLNYDLNPENATRMHKPKPDNESKEIVQTFDRPIFFYSKNSGNFNHFVNVVMAMARLIEYFREDNHGDGNLRQILFDNPRFRYSETYSKTENQNKLIKDLIFPNDPNIRVFKLMLMDS